MGRFTSHATSANVSEVLNRSAALIDSAGLQQIDQAFAGTAALGSLTLMDAMEIAAFGDVNDSRDKELSSLWVGAVSMVCDYLFDSHSWTWEDGADITLPSPDDPRLPANLRVDKWSHQRTTSAEMVAMVLRAAARS